MDSEEFLREYEESALEENSGEEIVSHVSGKRKNSFGNKKKGGKLKKFGAIGFLTAMLVVFVVLFSSGNLIPAALSDRLVEETDVQYADAMESKKLVFQQALYSGSVPKDTAELLKNRGVLVGYEENGEFIETNQRDGELSLKVDNEIISAKDFVKEEWENVKLYDAFNEATYGRAAYYYDASARNVFSRIGTTRNNYTSESDFDVVMDRMMGEGSAVSVNDVELVEKTRVLEDETVETYYDYELGGSAVESTSGFIEGVSEKNTAGSVTAATLNTADSLKVADTIAKEKRSSLFFLGVMENISKMKAGEGSESKLNEAMNYLYEPATTEVVDVKTGEVVKVSGTAFDSPSLSAILSGDKVSAESVENYSSDRVLRTVENQLGLETAAVTGVSSATREAMAGTVASAGTSSGGYSRGGSGILGAIGRFFSGGAERASQEIVNLVSPTISRSLVDNSFKTVHGVEAGEFLVEGAINVGKELAKASGATAGDSGAVLTYLNLQNATLAMDAKVDRMKRSPFDITSRSTFLGSIMYKLAVFSMKNRGLSGFSTLIRGVRNFSSMTSSAILSFTPGVYADESEGYLSTFGECKTLAMAGAVGSAGCAMIATFDTSTLNDTFNDSGFQAFVEANTSLEGGTRRVLEGSNLAKFIDYNNERVLPVGVLDGAAMSGSKGFFADILSMIKNWLGAGESEKRIATGAAFTNTSSNYDWNTYKYAQRYVSLARATEALKMFTSDATAYNIPYFEGNENPVIAYINRYNNVANK